MCIDHIDEWCNVQRFNEHYYSKMFQTTTWNVTKLSKIALWALLFRYYRKVMVSWVCVILFIGVCIHKRAGSICNLSPPLPHKQTVNRQSCKTSSRNAYFFQRQLHMCYRLSCLFAKWCVMSTGGSRISLTWGAKYPGGRGHQHTIVPKFPKNCMKFKDIGPRGARPKFDYVDPALLSQPYHYITV